MFARIAWVVALAVGLVGCSPKVGSKVEAPCDLGQVRQGGACVTPPPAATPTVTAEPEPESGVPYDVEAIRAILRDAAGRVRTHCGSATDSTGKMTGPWGRVEVSIVLWRGGRIRTEDVVLPAQFQETPAGQCIVRALESQSFGRYEAADNMVIRRVFTLTPPAQAVPSPSHSGAVTPPPPVKK